MNPLNDPNFDYRSWAERNPPVQLVDPPGMDAIRHITMQHYPSFMWRSPGPWFGPVAEAVARTKE